MKLTINLEQELTDEEFDLVADGFDIDEDESFEMKKRDLVVLLRSIIKAQLGKDNALEKPVKVDIRLD